MGLASKLAAAAAAAPQAYGVPGAAPSAAPAQQWPPAASAPPVQAYPPQQQQSYPPQPQMGQQYPPQQAAGYPPAASGMQHQQQGYYPPSQAQGYAPAAQQQAHYPPQAPAAYAPGNTAGARPPAPAASYYSGAPGPYPPQQAPAAASPYPQQGYAGAPGGASQRYGAPAGGVGAGAILGRLQKIVQVNSLQRFYPPQQLEAVAQRVARIDFQALATRWRMPLELALDFSALALYDIIMYCDDSGSIAFEDGGERIEDLKLILGRVAEVSTLFDDDGILVRFMNSPLEGNGIRSAQDAAALLGQVSFGGTTPLAASMQSRVLAPVVLATAARGQLAKPVLVVSITDGEPTDNPKDAILQVIRDARARLAPQYGPKAVAFQFAQVGRDARAQAFLGKLDRDPSVGDVIDCTSYFEQEAEEYARKGVQLSVEAWLLKLMVGAVDPSYDAEDETH